MSTKYHLQERIFLNINPEMRAYVIAVLEDTTGIPAVNETDWKWGTKELKIADCFEEISLEFDLSSKEGRANSLHKIRELTRVVTAFRDALEIEAASIDERQSYIPWTKAFSAVH
jgi:hypothetical protein